MSILAALENECAVPGFISPFAAFNDFILAQTVSVRICVFAPDAAIFAVSDAKIRKLYQPPQINLLPIVLSPFFISHRHQCSAYFFIFYRNKGFESLFAGHL